MDIDPGQAMPYNSVGITYALEDRPDLAEPFFSLAASISPSPTFSANVARAREAARRAAAGPR
jgi:hypothetical protein